MSDTTEEEHSSIRTPSTSPLAQPQGAASRPSNRSKAHIRVSLACVQCRSKHVKCDATLPACLRCQAEAKPCFYAKSRRGIRDPKKRSMISDRPPRSHSEQQSHPKPSHSPPATYRSDSPSQLSSGWYATGVRSQLAQPQAADDDVLIDLFYRYLHPSHPFLPPKKFFNIFFDADSDSYQFLLGAIKFCGSKFAGESASEQLRESAFTAACGPLPMTPQSVQGLLLLSIVACGDALFEHHAGWLDRALSIAMDIGMHQKSFADSASDAVLAESFRRTWYILFVQQSQRLMKHSQSKVDAADIEHNVDLPCEEWEYDSGVIPTPISAADYEIKKNLSRVEFSSLAYLVDICRIRTELVLPYLRSSEDKKKAWFDRADSRICDWLRRVPRWKLDLVDQDGVSDLVIHHAVNLAHVNRLRLRQAGLRSGLNVRDYFHLGPANGPYKSVKLNKYAGWKVQPTEIQAADSSCEFLRYNIPIKNLPPSIGSGLLVVALAYMDACVFLGLDSEAMREKINMLLHVLSSHGDTWKLSEMIAEEIRFVIKEYLNDPVAGGGQPLLSMDDAPWDPSLTMSTTEYVTNGLLHDSLMSMPSGQPVDFPGWDHVSHGASWLGITSA
ncbi:uncharacterized protein B0I36DRAFT_141218 [Microdochium trichocladiopsis]|uniref:Zn(2)-C6 fungal-type domain-containing protein n=1 Tax=Microdochium trichocladiopsis TaxID=1682393 RepID=A0A9P9BL25_9PEZI|nr:uncharacterized protein B0I36DRAFT_141218 [Microdochium trichocladiopsis]KAH7027637.1 hypothetical protein B0I36DRAFT_141218 [Microdochium trichocladiopsis]